MIRMVLEYTIPAAIAAQVRMITAAVLLACWKMPIFTIPRGRLPSRCWWRTENPAETHRLWVNLKWHRIRRVRSSLVVTLTFLHCLMWSLADLTSVRIPTCLAVSTPLISATPTGRSASIRPSLDTTPPLWTIHQCPVWPQLPITLFRAEVIDDLEKDVYNLRRTYYCKSRQELITTQVWSVFIVVMSILCRFCDPLWAYRFSHQTNTVINQGLNGIPSVQELYLTGYSDLSQFPLFFSSTLSSSLSLCQLLQYCCLTDDLCVVVDSFKSVKWCGCHHDPSRYAIVLSLQLFLISVSLRIFWAYFCLLSSAHNIVVINPYRS